ncbi:MULTISPECIES: AraC family transcriptional regulator [Aquimarina]|uniref:AraC family transcriptional regulator n=1 Tax=Aquimarina TaxID=290174 RepID=UPI000943938A|nr:MULTISPECIES: AraC family transcriptional regulator [Aquimarina]
MNKKNLYEPFSIAFETLDQSPVHEHKNSFFELVYILSGTGIQRVNKNEFLYHPGHMLLLTPTDISSIEINTTTQFFFLRFNDIYIKSGKISADNIQRLEFILKNANHQPGCILRNLTDKTLVKPMVEAMIREYVNRDLYNKEIIQQLVNTLIVIVARNIAKYLPDVIDSGTEEKAMNILQYIQENIYDPAKLRTEEICHQFGISKTYLGRYFKKHTKETLQQYITNYRVRLIENRLQYSDMRITEITDELGFTDVSHLNKFFKKNKGISPTKYRKEFI